MILDVKKLKQKSYSYTQKFAMTWMLSLRYYEVIRIKVELSLTLSKESQKCLVNAGIRTY